MAARATTTHEDQVVGLVALALEDLGRRLGRRPVRGPADVAGRTRSGDASGSHGAGRPKRGSGGARFIGPSRLSALTARRPGRPRRP